MNHMWLYVVCGTSWHLANELLKAPPFSSAVNFFLNPLLLFCSFTPSSSPLPSALSPFLCPPPEQPTANLRLFPTRWLICHYIITASPLLHPDVTRKCTHALSYFCISPSAQTPSVLISLALHTYFSSHRFHGSVVVFFMSSFSNLAINES